MRFVVTINKKGEITSEVLERQEGEICSNIRLITGSFGRETSSEQTGPECDTVQELS